MKFVLLLAAVLGLWAWSMAPRPAPVMLSAPLPFKAAGVGHPPDEGLLQRVKAVVAPEDEGCGG